MPAPSEHALAQSKIVLESETWEEALGWTLSAAGLLESMHLLRRKADEIERSLAAYRRATIDECEVGSPEYLEALEETKGVRNMSSHEYHRRYFGPEPCGCYPEEATNR